MKLKKILNEILNENSQLREFGIKELKDGLVLAKLQKDFSWIVESAIIKDAIIGYDKSKNTIIWYSGTWKDGTWDDGLWVDGTWENGTWWNGTWETGTWKKGTWKKGVWQTGVWENGTWERGEWWEGDWYGGIWKDKKNPKPNTITKGIINKKNGIKRLVDGLTLEYIEENFPWILRANIDKAILGFDKRTKRIIWYNGIWWDGEWEDGIWEFGTWWYGVWRNGLWKQGVWKNGHWHGGIWINGYWENGIWNVKKVEKKTPAGIWTDKNTIAPPIRKMPSDYMSTVKVKYK